MMIRGFVVKECIIDGLMDCTIELLLVLPVTCTVPYGKLALVVLVQ